MTDATGSRLAVCSQSARLDSAADRLAQALQLPLTDADDESFAILLSLVPDPDPPGYRLQLRETGTSAPGPTSAEFAGGAVDHRRRFGGGRGQPMARAVGLKGGATPAVLDATAGLGRDAFVLATLGCRLRLIERSPVIAALVQNALDRAAAHPEVAPIAARMTLLQGDARALLQDLREDQRPDVVYLDPMYPDRSKSALVKKEMRLFRALVGEDLDAPQLLKAALSCARKRVVVKRPRKAPALEGPKPTMTIEGKTTRFDVYVIGTVA